MRIHKIGACLVLLLITSCQLGRPNRTPQIIGQVDPNRVITYSDSKMPWRLNCSYIQTGWEGPTWKGITIGVTTRDQFNSILNVTPQWVDGLRYSNPDKSLSSNWNFVDVCFIEDTVVAMRLQEYSNHSDAEFPMYLEEWVQKYGPPEYVTWANDYDDRTLIWPELGLLAVVEIPFDEIINIILFAPMPLEALKESWVIQSLPEEGQERPTEVDYELPPRSMEVEDPWNFTR